MIGTDIARYDIYGRDVIIANLMESEGEPDRINISERTKKIIEKSQSRNFSYEFNKKIDIEIFNENIDSFFLNYN